MKLDCANCHTRYNVADAIVPPHGAKIRCRKCGAVIMVPPRHEAAPAASPLIPPSPEVAAPSVPSHSRPITPPGHVTVTPPSPRATSPVAAPRAAELLFESGQDTPGATTPSPPPPPAPPAAAPAAPPVAPTQEGPAARSAGIPFGLAEEEKKEHERARRLARVLASDIAIYNQEKKDRGLAEGNLVAVLGYEIKKSWEIYKERVGSDFANATPYFRDALNDLLAEGKRIF